jgi:glutamate-ammonia-ligase adenylyltransferase
VFLRRIEHRLQIMLDLQTHVLPESDDELGKLALRMGYAAGPIANLPNEAGQACSLPNNVGQVANLPGKRQIGNLPHVPSAKDALLGDYRRRTALNRKILDHLLHDAFSGDPQVQAEVDLVLDPDPPVERVENVLSKYRFRDAAQAYGNLMSLAEERIRFLSTRRCRHFLAAIAPELLATIAETADPDSTLVSLDKVSDSLGGKGVLWELFSFNPPSLRLYVELCAHSPYLSGILTSNPGMIDGLMDSLVLDKLPTRESMAQSLAELCRAAEDLDPILKSFKNDQQLCVGVRDILGKDDVQATTGALSDIAEVCLGRIADRELLHLAGRFGQPSSPPVIVALGKFGGRAMNYHSDLDIIFLYEADGQTKAEGPAAAKHATTNQHFFSELAQRIVTATSRPSGYGRLYEVDARLRPTGHSGALATSFDEFARYFDSGAGQLWERMALCKARIVYGPPAAAAAARGLLARAAFSRPWQPGDAATIRQMRQRLEQAAAAGDLKRGPGGIVDVEFLVEMLQLRHAAAHPPLQVSNTLAALAALHRAGLVSHEDHDLFGGGYRLLRTIESRLRLISATARDTLPDDRLELSKLAHLSRYVSVQALLSDYETATRQIRRRFEEFFA